MQKKQMFSYLIKSDKYKIIYLLLVVLALYGHFILGLNIDNIWRSILLSFQFNYFNVLFFVVSFITTVHVIEAFNNQFKDVVLRLKNKKIYIYNLVFMNFVMYLFNIMLFGIIYFPLVIISNFVTTKKDIILLYDIDTWIYAIYYLGRYFVVLFFINIISLFIYLNFGTIKMYIFQLFILLLLIIEKLFGFNDKLYLSFNRDILISIFIIILVITVIIFLYFYLLKRRKLDIGLKNDFNYLKKNKIKLLLLFLLINVISLTLHLTEEIPSLEKIMFSNATNILKDEFSIIQYIIFLFNNIVFIFLILDLFIKDLNYELDNLFMRIKIFKWMFTKFSFVIIVTIVLKLLEYLSLFFCLYLLSTISWNIELVNLIVIDIVYTLSIEFSYLFLYILFYRANNIFIYYIVGVFLFLVIPKNVYNLHKYILFLLLILLIIIVAIFLITKKFHKKMIEKLRSN